MKKYVCTVCGYVYDPEIGDPDSGIAAGTAFEDIPDGWVCPVCGVGKEMFEAQSKREKAKKRPARKGGIFCALEFF